MDRTPRPATTLSCAAGPPRPASPQGPDKKQDCRSTREENAARSNGLPTLARLAHCLRVTAPVGGWPIELLRQRVGSAIWRRVRADRRGAGRAHLRAAGARPQDGARLRGRRAPRCPARAALCCGTQRFSQVGLSAGVDPARSRRRQSGRAIGELFPAMPWIGAAPVFFVFLGDARRLQRIGELRGKPVANGTLEGFFNASVDAALAMQTLILCGGDGRARLLSDQRHSQQDRRGRRDPGVARPGVSGRGSVSRMSGSALASSACACRGP